MTPSQGAWGIPHKGSASQAYCGIVAGAAGEFGDGVGRGLEAEVLAVGGEIAFDDGVGGFVRGFAVAALVSRPK